MAKWIFRTIGVLIDAFEMILVGAMTALGATALGAVGGCAVGAQIAGKVGCAVGGVLGGLVGTAAQGTGAGEVIGFMLGYILSICITFSFGTMLVFFLILTGKFKFFPTLYVYVIKLVPVAGIAPAWAWYAWRCTTNRIGVTKQVAANTPQEPYAQAA